MSWLVTIIVGIIVGLIVGAVMQASWRMGLWTNIWVGILGSIFGVWFFAFVLGIGTIDTSAGAFQGISLLWQIIGAVVALLVVNSTAYAEAPQDVKRHMGEYSPSSAHEYRRKSRRDEDE